MIPSPQTRRTPSVPRHGTVRDRLTKIDPGDTTTYTYDAANQLSTEDDGTTVTTERAGLCSAARREQQGLGLS